MAADDAHNDGGPEELHVDQVSRFNTRQNNDDQDTLMNNEYDEGDDKENVEEIILQVDEGVVMCPDEVMDYLLRSDGHAFDKLNVWDYVVTVTKLTSVEDS